MQVGVVKNRNLLWFDSVGHSKQPCAKIIAIASSVVKIHDVQVSRGLRPLLCYACAVTHLAAVIGCVVTKS